MILRLYKIFLSITEISNLLYLLTTTLLSPICRAIKPKRIKNVRNKIVLITGAGNGIGRQLALKFAEKNAVTVLWDINEVIHFYFGIDLKKKVFFFSSKANVQQTAEMIKKMHHSTTFCYTVDVSNENQVANTAEQVRIEVGDVDILINNAGIAPCEPFKKLSNEKIREIFNINILAHFWVIS